MNIAHDLGASRFGARPAAPEPVEGDDGAVDIVYDWNLQSDEIAWSSSYKTVPGLPGLDLVSSGLGYAEHLAAESQSSRYEAIMMPGSCDTGNGVPFTVIYGLVAAKRSQAAPVWVEDSGRWYADVNGRPCRVHGAVRVITERFEAERLRNAAAQRDPATGAFTRAHFIDHVTRRLGLAGRKSATFAVVLIGIDGPARPELAGDGDMLAAMGLLRSEMRSHEMLARYSSTKFVALLEGCDESQAVAAASRLIAAVGSAPEPTPLAARVGIVIAPCQGRTPQALLQFAEEAFDATSEPGSASFSLYRPEAGRTRLQPAQDAADEFIAALNENRVLLALQPIVDARSREVAFFEGLVRVSRPGGGFIYPDALVAVAEKNGLVAVLDRRVIELAFTLLTADRKLVLSINAAVPSLTDPRWLDQLRNASRRRPDAARRLIVEVTETCVVADLEATCRALEDVKALGVRIAIDDFGSGHSSFRNIRELPVDFIKIDGAFAQNLAKSQDDRFFIRTLIELARNLGIPTVVEWVGDEATASILAEWGVNFLQGHLFGKAEPAALPA